MSPFVDLGEQDRPEILDQIEERSGGLSLCHNLPQCNRVAERRRVNGSVHHDFQPRDQLSDLLSRQTATDMSRNLLLPERHTLNLVLRRTAAAVNKQYGRQ